MSSSTKTVEQKRKIASRSIFGGSRFPGRISPGNGTGSGSGRFSAANGSWQSGTDGVVGSAVYCRSHGFASKQTSKRSDAGRFAMANGFPAGSPGLFPEMVPAWLGHSVS